MLDPITLARAILEVGARGVDEVNQEIRVLEASLSVLGTAYGQGKLKITEYASESQRLLGQIDRLKVGLSAAEAAISQQTNPRAREGGQPFTPFGLVDQVAAGRTGDTETSKGEATSDKEQGAEREATRLANALESSVGKTILDHADRSEDSLRSRVRNALAMAGVSAQEIGELTTRVTDKLSAWADDHISKRALRIGSTDAEAAGVLLKEASEPESETRSKSSGLSTPHSAVVPDRLYLDRMLVAGFSKSGEWGKIATRQLEEQKNTNKKLDGLTRAVMDRNRKGDVARFARGRT